MTNPSVSECVLCCAWRWRDKGQLFSEGQLDHVMLPRTLGPSTWGTLP